MQRSLRERPKAGHPGWEERARRPSSLAKLASSPRTLGQAARRRAGSGALRADGDRRLPSPGCAPLPGLTAPAGRQGSDRAPALLESAASLPPSAARQRLRAGQPCLWPCSPSSRRSRGQVSPSDTFPNVTPEPPGYFFFFFFLAPGSSWGKESGGERP